MINVTGTLINLYQVCKRETWLHANGIRMEHTSDVVTEGKLVHETSYPNRAARYEEVRIGGSVIDFYDPKEKVIHEIKKSTSKEEAYIWQVKYYLLLFEREGIADVVGMLEYPLLRETMRVELEEGDREILRQMEVEIRQLIGEEACPPALSKGKCCDSVSDCFYSVPGDPPFDFCRKFVCLVPFVFCFVIGFGNDFGQ